MMKKPRHMEIIWQVNRERNTGDRVNPCNDMNICFLSDDSVVAPILLMMIMLSKTQSLASTMHQAKDKGQKSPWPVPPISLESITDSLWGHPTILSPIP
jgi:hypothetical protein